ncbi:hypothetical protein GCM10027445_47040 [Amycolatopsis endophytica]|uniref:Uncharacterized protein n=1 Tax=Amycolatopsis endophytica TaxID=860233 RepID=A0A853BAS5_9PSEU|nr:hypothetical protein [Amycolatopsis endophytica]NYI92478.1 hypothetical protein [Amycolatopsis endophytica]
MGEGVTEEPGKQAEPQRLALHQEDRGQARKRLVSGLVGVLIMAAAFGGIAGLIGGRIAGLVAALVIGLPLLYVVLWNVRRKLWLEGTAVLVRTWRTRRVDLAAAKRIDLLVTDVRGARTVSLLFNSGQRGQVVKIDVAVYSGTGGREMPILTLRRLADALANNIEANGLVFSELLVAQLRAEARGAGVSERPLYQLASAAPSGKIAQRFTMEAVSRFVARLG